MQERPRTWEREERRALAADLVRTQATLEARSEQLQAIFGSRWYRLARFAWRLRRGRLFRKAVPPRMAGEESFARPLDGAMVEPDPQLPPARAPAPSLERPREGAGSRTGRARLLLVGHSLSFCEPVARRARGGGAAVREDRWRTHREHDEEASAAALAWADVVLCEWCLGNAVWYSANKLDGQRLVVRFHRMELETDFPGEIDLERVDALVFVARHVLESACERWGWDPDNPRFHVVPNGVDAGELALPKRPGAELTLAIIGWVPRLKRLDRALDVLEALRARDERWRLLVKGREPWEYPWMAGREEERGYFGDLFERLERTPGLREAVAFEPHDDDVAGFLGGAGWVLSTSEVEGHSVALAEGMASGAVPVILGRPGAAEQYEERWVHADPAAAAAAILAIREQGETAREGEAARELAERWSWGRLGPLWDRLLAGEAAPLERL